jgi:multimeric flavodoxin WrbA
MKILAIMGSYRQGKTIDTLVDRAIAGAESAPGVHVEKVVLVDKNIEYCRNCMACRNDDASKSRARCVIDDDMQDIYPLIEEADGYIFGTPVNMGHVTAVTKTFLERICWVFARPGKKPIPGCPTPRSTQEKKLVVIVSSGIVPPFMRRFCDDATSLIQVTARDSLNARLVGSLYAGAVEKRGIERYAEKAFALGKRLTA